MKKTLLILLACICANVYAQNNQIQSLNHNISFGNKKQNKLTIKSKGTTTCSNDSVQYTLAKTTGLQALSINNATSAQAVSQYFNAPQGITISGVTFYAYKIDANGGTFLNASVEVYLAGPDSMPAGPALVSGTVLVDTTFGSGNLSALEKNITFPSPIVVNQPYVIVIGNNTANGMGMIFSDYTAAPADGQQEWLASVDLFGTWTRSYSIVVGGNVFDADGLIYPHVSYDLTANFSATPTQFSSPTTVTFTDNSSPILKDRMYNQAAYLNVTNLSYTYNFGDGSPTVNAIDTTHNYTAAQQYTVTLCDTMYGWTTTCTEKDSIILNQITTGIESANTSDVKIFPNPTKNIFNVALNSIEKANLTVYSVDGKIVYQNNSVNDRILSIDLSDNSTGLYFIKVETINDTKVYKLIKE